MAEPEPEPEPAATTQLLSLLAVPSPAGPRGFHLSAPSFAAMWTFGFFRPQRKRRRVDPGQRAHCGPFPLGRGQNRYAWVFLGDRHPGPPPFNQIPRRAGRPGQRARACERYDPAVGLGRRALGLHRQRGEPEPRNARRRAQRAGHPAASNFHAALGSPAFFPLGDGPSIVDLAQIEWLARRPAEDIESSWASSKSVESASSTAKRQGANQRVRHHRRRLLARYNHPGKPAGPQGCGHKFRGR